MHACDRDTEGRCTRQPCPYDEKPRPSRELDGLVATHVFKCHRIRGLTGDPVCNCVADWPKDKPLALPHASPGWRNVKPYSTDIAAAWEVVEKMMESKPYPLSLSYHYPKWECWPGHYEYRAVADTLPKAICLAALKAKGVNL